MKADIGLVGLAVMGQNLVLNMVDHGYTVAVHNRTSSKVTEFVSSAATEKILGAHDIEEFVNLLSSPRKIMLMVKAGSPVDAFIAQILPLLSEGDLLIDGGNSNFNDTIRRSKMLAEKGILFIGAGVSGGEEGARYGPSIMPGGHPDAWPMIKNIFQDISAKVEDGSPCCDWVGSDGAGHYVKMVHNGIEYGDMELIIESYQMMRDLLGMKADEIADVFDTWNKGKLDSYLIEITATILRKKDDDGSPLVNKILDTAGQKGTGKWTAISALDLGIPVTLIGEAVFQRCLSALKQDRVRASKFYGRKVTSSKIDRETFIRKLERALYASKIISYSQGFSLMKEAAKEYGWNLNYGAIALMWRGGCIIRSIFLGEIKKAFDTDPSLESLLLSNYFKQEITECINDWRDIVVDAIRGGIPVPGISSALNFFDGYTSEFLPANLLQAQRDYFGAHTYQRLDDPSGEVYHTNWSENE